MPTLGDKVILVNKSDRDDNRGISTDLERNSTDPKRLPFNWADKLSFYRAHKCCIPLSKDNLSL